MKKNTLGIILLFWSQLSLAQEAKNPEKMKNLKVGGYLDTYFSYDFSNPSSRDKPYFVSSARHNEVTVNLAYIDLQYQSERFRAKLAPGFGTYMNSNYAGEPQTLKNLVEANVGIKLSKKKEIWLDMGVMGSPFTDENALSMNQLCYTRSYAPEYVPYYVSGAKLTLPLSSKLIWYFWVLNGWQQIQDLNTQKSITSQLEFRPAEKLMFNWNIYVGDERSVAAPNFRKRYFTDLYMVYNPDGKFSSTVCSYIGNQKSVNQANEEEDRIWWQINSSVRYRFTPSWSLSSRLEYFDDPKSVQITSINPLTSGFAAGSFTLGLNYAIDKNILLRFENRNFFSFKEIYKNKNGDPSNSGQALTTSLAVTF
jgi:hypothetical protein